MISRDSQGQEYIEQPNIRRKLEALYGGHRGLPSYAKWSEYEPPELIAWDTLGRKVWFRVSTGAIAASNSCMSSDDCEKLLDRVCKDSIERPAKRRGWS